MLSHMWGVPQTSNDPKKSDMLMLMVPLFPQSIPKKRSLLLEMAKQTKLLIYGNRLLLVCTATKMRGNLFASLQKLFHHLTLNPAHFRWPWGYQALLARVQELCFATFYDNQCNGLCCWLYTGYFFSLALLKNKKYAKHIRLS